MADFGADPALAKAEPVARLGPSGFDPGEGGSFAGRSLLRRSSGTPIDISALGNFRISDEALADIRAIERRQQRVIATSHLFTFGGSNDR